MQWQWCCFPPPLRSFSRAGLSRAASKGKPRPPLSRRVRGLAPRARLLSSSRLGEAFYAACAFARHR
eukprot:9482919-Pyramimonas_sp.AAC.1